MDQNAETQKSFAQTATPYIFAVLCAFFVILYNFDKPLYLAIIREDSLAEWMTFAFLVATGIISLITGMLVKKRYGYLHWFFLLFFAFNFLAGLEEISWGQRVFNMKTEGVFAKYSDQNEINFHNTMQGLFMVKTKHIAMYVLFFYGVILPWLLKKGKINFEWLKRVQFIVPPMFLRVGFLIASLLMIDIPTGQEEEIGEFFYSICFLLMMLYTYHLAKYTDAFEIPAQDIRS